jgi:N4-(beta-N-acetylglucosaminyl)-L-asparaginase
MSLHRRELLKAGILAAAAPALAGGSSNPPSPAEKTAGTVSNGPVVISSNNGERVVNKAMDLLRAGSDPLDAVIAGVSILEDDPDVMTVGYGGVPNEEGVVELDASVMDGRSMKAGAVGALHDVRYASRVARTVMDRTDRVMIVGEGALKFARAHGFKTENLLTERARKVWLYWRENLSDQDDWVEPEEKDIDPDVLWFFKKYGRNEFRKHQGTVHAAARDRSGNLVGTTSTSGLFFKIPGRLGDSPIVGAGLYVANDAGSCGATGWGEANMRACGSFSVVEEMRRGLAPLDAAMKTLERMARLVKDRRLLTPEGRPKNNVVLYALSKDGRHAGASFFSGSKYWVHDGTSARQIDCASLFENKVP